MPEPSVPEEKPQTPNEEAIAIAREQWPILRLFKVLVTEGGQYMKRNFIGLGLFAVMAAGIGYAIRSSLSEEEALRGQVTDLRAKVVNLERDLQLEKKENSGLRETVAPLMLRAAELFPHEAFSSTQKRIIQLLEESAASSPKQPIKSAIATVVVEIESEEKGNNVVLGQCAIAFVKDRKPIWIARNESTYTKRELGNKTLEIRAEMAMSATDDSINRPISHLADSKVFQVEFGGETKDAKVKKGTVIITFNNAFRIELPIERQLARTDGRIYATLNDDFRTQLAPDKK